MELQDGTNGTIGLMTKWERSFMNSEGYLEDWFIDDRVMEQIGLAEYEIYMQECFEAGEEY